MTFTNPPLDPHWVKFEEGWSRIIGKKQQILRWSPSSGGGSWVEYPWDKYEFIDSGVVGPGSPLKSVHDFLTPGGILLWEWADVWSKSKLPDLYRRVTEVYNLYKASEPTAVWNPYDGSWRQPRDKQSTDENDREKEYHERLRLLEADFKAGRITDEIYKLRKLELNREYR